MIDINERVYEQVTYTETPDISDQENFENHNLSSNCRLELSENQIALSRGKNGEATDTEQYLGQTWLTRIQQQI